jgi:hypothetical protein
VPKWTSIQDPCMLTMQLNFPTFAHPHIAAFPLSSLACWHNQAAGSRKSVCLSGHRLSQRQIWPEIPGLCAQNWFRSKGSSHSGQSHFMLFIHTI